MEVQSEGKLFTIVKEKKPTLVRWVKPCVVPSNYAAVARAAGALGAAGVVVLGWREPDPDEIKGPLIWTGTEPGTAISNGLIR